MLGVYSFNTSPTEQEVLFDTTFYGVLFHSVTYKRFLSTNAAIRFTYYKPIKKTNAQPPDNWIDNSDYKKNSYAVGYEYLWNRQRFSPYIALDMYYTHSVGTRITGGGFTGLTTSTEMTEKGVGILPILGMHYKVLKQFYIGIETSVNIVFSNSKDTLYDSSILSETSSNTQSSNGTNIFINPFQCVLKFRF